jgi:hypothetical protein
MSQEELEAVVQPALRLLHYFVTAGLVSNMRSALELAMIQETSNHPTMQN